MSLWKHPQRHNTARDPPAVLPAAPEHRGFVLTAAQKHSSQAELNYVLALLKL